MSPATHIKLIISDVDGVWTDGKIIYVGEKNRPSPASYVKTFCSGAA